MWTRINTDGTDAAFTNWSGEDPGMPDQASPPPQTVVASGSGATSQPSGGSPPSDNAPTLAPGGSDPATPLGTWVLPTPLPAGSSDASPTSAAGAPYPTWVLPTPLPSGWPSETPAGSGDAPPTSAAGAPYPIWVLPTPLPSSPPSDSVTGGGGLTSTFASGGSDPLMAFLDGLQGMSGNAGPPLNGPDASIATMLSNGLNADAGVAQLVGALAGLPDSNSAFDASPFARVNDPYPQMTIVASSGS
jgi:hypothetical protein